MDTVSVTFKHSGGSQFWDVIQNINGFNWISDRPDEMFGYEGCVANWVKFANEYRGNISLIGLRAETITPEMLYDTCKNHLDLEELSISETALNKEQWDHIGLLTKLKTLQVTIEQNKFQDITFVQNLESLERLNFKSNGTRGKSGGYNWINFEIEFHNLKILELENFAQSRTNYPLMKFTNWFEPFANVEEVRFKDYHVMHWRDFFANISTLKKLHTLELINVDHYRSDKNDIVKGDFSLPSLKVLKLRNCSMEQEELQEFLNGCPNLE